MEIGSLFLLPLTLIFLFFFWYGLYLLLTKKNLKELCSLTEKISVAFFISYFWLGGIILFFLKLFTLLGSSVFPESFSKIKDTVLYKHFILQNRGCTIFKTFVFQGHGYIDLIYFFLFSAFFTIILVRLWKSLGWKIVVIGMLLALTGWFGALLL